MYCIVLSILYYCIWQVAQGRVWTGKQALAVGLVDGIGGLWQAVDIAYRLAGISLNTTRDGKRPTIIYIAYL